MATEKNNKHGQLWIFHYFYEFSAIFQLQKYDETKNLYKRGTELIVGKQEDIQLCTFAIAVYYVNKGLN